MLLHLGHALHMQVAPVAQHGTMETIEDARHATSPFPAARFKREREARRARGMPHDRRGGRHSDDGPKSRQCALREVLILCAFLLCILILAARLFVILW